MLFLRAPSYDHFHPFGCQVYPYLRDYAEHKLSPRSLPCIFLGYCAQYKGYVCLEPDSSRIFITRHAKFDEFFFPFGGTASRASIHDLRLVAFLDDASSSSFPSTPAPSPSPQPTVPTTSCGLCDDPAPVAEARSSDQAESPVHAHSPDRTQSPIDAQSPVSSNNLPPPVLFDETEPNSPTATPSPVPPTGGHSMVTRAKSGIFKPKHRVDLAHTTKHGLYSALFAQQDPTTFSSAASQSHWVNAMNAEMHALRNNHTWSLVPRPMDRNVVGCKWVFRTKYHSDGTIDRHKALLVAQGFSKLSGVDYSHTFSPVVKASTVPIVLSLAIINGWSLHQLDVNNAFLHGTLSDPVYMEQPQGFHDPRFPGHVCRLYKALYGLKHPHGLGFIG